MDRMFNRESLSSRIIASLDPTTRKAINNISIKRSNVPSVVVETAAQPMTHMNHGESSSISSAPFAIQSDHRAAEDKVEAISIDKDSHIKNLKRLVETEEIDGPIIRQIVEILQSLLSGTDILISMEILALPRLYDVINLMPPQSSDALIQRALDAVANGSWNEDLEKVTRKIEGFFLSLSKSEAIVKLQTYLSQATGGPRRKARNRRLPELLSAWTAAVFLAVSDEEANELRIYFADSANFKNFLNVIMSLYCILVHETSKSQVLDILAALRLFNTPDFEKRIQTFDYEVVEEILRVLPDANSQEDENTEVQENAPSVLADMPFIEEESMLLDGNSEMFNASNFLEAGLSTVISLILHNRKLFLMHLPMLAI
jgi:hypothetical protein